MAGKRRNYEFILDLPVSFKDIGIGDKTARVGISPPIASTSAGS